MVGHLGGSLFLVTSIVEITHSRSPLGRPGHLGQMAVCGMDENIGSSQSRCFETKKNGLTQRDVGEFMRAAVAWNGTPRGVLGYSWQ